MSFHFQTETSLLLSLHRLFSLKRLPEWSALVFINHKVKVKEYNSLHVVAIHASAKAFIAENCDESNIGLAFTLAVQSYSIGCMIGPIIGGKDKITVNDCYNEHIAC